MQSAKSVHQTPCKRNATPQREQALASQGATRISHSLAMPRSKHEATLAHALDQFSPSFTIACRRFIHRLPASIIPRKSSFERFWQAREKGCSPVTIQKHTSEINERQAVQHRVDGASEGASAATRGTNGKQCDP